VRLSGDHHPEFLVIVQPEGGLPAAAPAPVAVAQPAAEELVDEAEMEEYEA